MWILILSVVSTVYGGGNSSIAVAQMTSQETCMTAAKTWLKEQSKIASDQGSSRFSYSAVCSKA